MTAVDVSSYAGLCAMVLLTVNILLGLLLSARYNTVLNWPHRRLPIFDVHNWTAYVALGLILFHPAALLFSSTAGFKLLDVLCRFIRQSKRSTTVWVPVLSTW